VSVSVSAGACVLVHRKRVLGKGPHGSLFTVHCSLFTGQRMVTGPCTATHHFTCTAKRHAAASWHHTTISTGTTTQPHLILAHAVRDGRHAGGRWRRRRAAPGAASLVVVLQAEQQRFDAVDDVRHQRLDVAQLGRGAVAAVERVSVLAEAWLRWQAAQAATYDVVHHRLAWPGVEL
jgi:hypothetical protein